MADGLWGYAVAGPLERGTVTGLRGVAGADVDTVAAGGLTAVVSPVSLAEFGAEALRRNLENLDWLAATARAHDAVVAAVSRVATAVPLRLATVYLDGDGVRALLATQAARFHTALELLTGRTEWGVKAYADPESLAEHGGLARKPAGRHGAGTAYLLRRREQLSERERAQQQAVERTERLHAALAELAVAACRHRPQDQKLSGEAGWMVLNGAYLVDDLRAAEFAAAVERLGAELPGFRLQLTGPWPPYSFAGREGELA
jgi:hypothetical protein